MRAGSLSFVLLALVGCRTMGALPALRLASGGVAEYAVVMPEAPTEVDVYAVTALTNALFQKTGAPFSVLEPNQVTPTNACLFVGLNKPALARLGPDPLAALQPQEHVVCNVGRDICLYGEGVHGNFNAIMLFMEAELGRRWYDPHQPPHCVKQAELTLKPFSHRQRFSFRYRTLPGIDEWGYQNGKNIDYPFGERHRSGFVPDLHLDLPMYAAQTSFTYIPPAPDHVAVLRHFPWMTNEHYFTTNPEFFSRNQRGLRVAKQLCFSNPRLRQEFTRNLLQHLEAIRRDQAVPAELRKRTVVSIGDTDDNSLKRLCHCPNCLALEQTYHSNGGPMFDYVIEFGQILKQQHPEARVKFTAYRLWHTVVPPVLPAGKAFPDNVIVHFAAVEDKHNYPWSDPRNNHGAFAEYLKQWGTLVKHVWVWYYPSYYGIGAMLPYGAIDRMAADMKLMKDVGVECIYNEDYNPQRHISAGFAPLSSYAFLRLARDVNVDPAQLLRDYTDHTYGAGAGLARRYLEELEAEHRDAVFPTSLSAAQFNVQGEFSYLSLTNICRWQLGFDEMARLTAADPRCHRNVGLLRRPLELATLLRFRELQQAYPQTFNDYETHRRRVPNPRKEEDDILFRSDMRLKLADLSRGVPSQLKGIPAERLHREFVHTASSVRDPEAALGCATAIQPELPLTFGIYQLLDDHWDGRAGTRYDRSLGLDQIRPGHYQLHKLGEIEVVRGTHLWFTRSWRPELRFGGDLYKPGQDNRYDLYVSLKCDGPLYRGKASADMVWCDQVILIKK